MTKESLPSTEKKLDESQAKAIEAQAEQKHGDSHHGHHESGPFPKAGWFLFGVVTVTVLLIKKAYAGLEWLNSNASKGELKFGGGGGDHGGGHGGGGKKDDHGGGHH